MICKKTKTMDFSLISYWITLGRDLVMAKTIYTEEALIATDNTFCMHTDNGIKTDFIKI